jgi:8-oxo-dGTP pyrophosphatase MutT (NUDIX family)
MIYENIGNKPKNASAVIISYKKKVLLNLRSNKKNIFYPNHWGCFGGAKDDHETYINAAIRELLEETNIKVNKKEIKFFFNLDFIFPTNKKLIKRSYFIFNILNINSFKKKFLLSEGVNYKFFSKKKFLSIKSIVPYDKLAIDLFFRYFC